MTHLATFGGRKPVCMMARRVKGGGSWSRDFKDVTCPLCRVVWDWALMNGIKTHTQKYRFSKSSGEKGTRKVLVLSGKSLSVKLELASQPFCQESLMGRKLKIEDVPMIAGVPVPAAPQPYRPQLADQAGGAFAKGLASPKAAGVTPDKVEKKRGPAAYTDQARAEIIGPVLRGELNLRQLNLQTGISPASLRSWADKFSNGQFQPSSKGGRPRGSTQSRMLDADVDPNPNDNRPERPLPRSEVNALAKAGQQRGFQPYKAPSNPGTTEVDTIHSAMDLFVHLAGRFPIEQRHEFISQLMKRLLK